MSKDLEIKKKKMPYRYSWAKEHLKSKLVMLNGVGPHIHADDIIDFAKQHRFPVEDLTELVSEIRKEALNERSNNNV